MADYGEPQGPPPTTSAYATPPGPQGPPLPPYPVWDNAGPTFQHLFEASSPEDSAALFNGYTAGGWNFKEADMTESLFALVYEAGPVSWE
jgi:hypothetical protein